MNEHWINNEVLTEVTSFLVEFARGNKATASTMAAQAAAAVIDFSMTILRFLFVRTVDSFEELTA